MNKRKYFILCMNCIFCVLFSTSVFVSYFNSIASIIVLVLSFIVLIITEIISHLLNKISKDLINNNKKNYTGFIKTLYEVFFN